MSVVPAAVKYPGGKKYLAQRILEEAARLQHDQYVETHFGGGKVLFAKPYEGVAEIANDLDERLMTFWKVLQSDELFKQFQRRIEATPFSQQQFEEALEITEYKHDAGDVEVAWAFFIVCRQSRSADQKGFAPITKNRTRRGMNEQVSAWLTAIDGLPYVHQRLRRVLLLKIRDCQIIPQQDSKSTLFYLDPTYITAKMLEQLGGTESQIATARSTEKIYRHEMSLTAHQEMLKALANIQGKFILSGYDNPLYADYAKQCGWRRLDVVIDNKMSGKKIKETKTESLWMNF